MDQGRQIIDQLFRRQPAARMGVNDHPWGDTLEKWATQGYPTNDDGNPIDSTEHFDFDIGSCGGWFHWEPKIDDNETLEETDEWKVVRNGAGAVLKWWKHKSGTPEHIDFHMTSREIWDREYRPLLSASMERWGKLEDLKANYASSQQTDRFGALSCQFLWENMRASMGDYVMFMSLVDDPAWVHDYNRVYTDLYIGQFKLYFEQVGKPDGVFIYEDLGYRNGLFCSPRVMEELIFPYYAELVAFCHDHDLPVMLHACGNITEAMDLVVQAGFDAINPMEVKAGNDTLTYAEKYGEHLTFVGGLDARILERGDKAEIRQGVLDYVTGMKDRGARLVFGSDHSLSTNIDYQDFAYAIEVFKENMWY
jgi:uroporphyrinogen decarboxylase